MSPQGGFGEAFEASAGRAWNVLADSSVITGDVNFEAADGLERHLARFAAELTSLV